MGKVTFSPERQPPPIDQRLQQAAGQAVLMDRPIRLRLQPDLWDYDKGNYSAWSGLSWVLELDDVEEGRRARQALQALWAVFGHSAEVQAQLITLLDEWGVALVADATARGVAGEELAEGERL